MESSEAVPHVPGDVVRTSYGVGVLISCPSPNSHDGAHNTGSSLYHVRLWRLPGTSIGSSSLASLRPDAILGRLPAAPGMIAKLKDTGEQRQVMVHCYYESRGIYLVSCLNEETATKCQSVTEQNVASSGTEQMKWMEASTDQLETAASAKFYPLLDELMNRGDMTASATRALMKDERVSNLVQKSTELVKSSRSKATESVPSVEDVTSSVQSVIPKEEDVKQVYSMLKDEELTVLLQKGRARLQQLVQNEIPEATQLALQQIGISVVSDGGNESSFSQSIAKSQVKALSALEEFMNDLNVDSADLQELRGRLEDNFTLMFDSLSQAAKSDRALSSIFDTIVGKTVGWQEATGRLMSTKSANLFMEGASRLQARAALLFSKDQMQWAGEVGSKLTKSFTEGDAALARLKSIELGDAVRNRLVAAIEARSESHGGLDGIIAGALTTINIGSEKSGDEMQRMLANLQTTASSATKGAHETLISVLSHRSRYRDMALLRLESVLCDLESYLGDDLSPQDIAALARGEGGTAALFEPIARRAAKEIAAGLDIAEESVADPTILGVLQHVRKIISGELTISGLSDEVVNILNDNAVVAAGESFLSHGESVLDALEGVSGNKVVDDVIGIAEKAGITKDSVMEQVESLNVNEILDTAGQAVTDEEARRKLVSSATDVALDFILRILPSMPIPPFDGVREGLVYHLSNLSMKGFKVKKENIIVEVAGMRATMTKSQRKYQQFDRDRDYVDSRWNSDREFDPMPPYTSFESDMSLGEIVMSPTSSVKATELLIIDVRQISAVLDDAFWSFEQTYMPYLKGSGMANSRLSDGRLKLSFELRKHKISASEWEPVLCLHNRSCSIQEIELVLQGDSRLTWIVNKLAAIFKTPLRDYVVKTIVSILTNKSGWILEQLNTNLSPYWGLILKTAGLSMDDLVEADDSVVTAAKSLDAEKLVELVWRQNLPLGMNLLLNDESGLLKVVDFPRGSQARVVCVERNFEPAAFNGSTIVAVNGSHYETRDELFAALKDPTRPKSIMFRLAEMDDAERVKDFVESSRPGGAKKRQSSSQSSEETRQNSFMLRWALFEDEGELGIQFAPAVDDFGLVVNAFMDGDDGIVLAAERNNNVCLGDLLTHVNGELVLGADGFGKQQALSLLGSSGQLRPLTLKLTEPYTFRETFQKPDKGIFELGGPEEFVLAEKQLSNGAKRVYVKDFQEVPGAAEVQGVLIGDHLAFVNGVPVGAGCRFIGEGSSPDLSEVYDMLRDPSSYPVGLTFARPMESSGSRWAKSSQAAPLDVGSARTVAVAAESFVELGCVLENKDGSDVVVTDLFAVPGPIQTQMGSRMDTRGKVHLSIESVNAQFVPSYATADMVRNAMMRSWQSSGRMEILFCDDTRKEWVHSLE